MTTIKFSAGDKVFWLSSKGFEKGSIKSIVFTDERQRGGKVKSVKSLKYYLSNDVDSPYQGDVVKEHLIFTDYNSMVEYYKSNPIT